MIFARPTVKMRLCGAHLCTKSPNTPRRREESRRPLDLHNRVVQMPSVVPWAKRSSNSGSVYVAQRIPEPAVRRWPRRSDPWIGSARLRLLASLPELANGWVPVAGHSQPAHPRGGGTSQARGEATKLGHSFPSSTTFGRRRAWAELCDCRDQATYVPEQVARWASGVAFSRIFPELHCKLMFIHRHIEIFNLTFPGISRNIQ